MNGLKQRISNDSSERRADGDSDMKALSEAPAAANQGVSARGDENSGAVASDALGSAKILFLSGVFHKMCTFTLNQLMIRYSSPELFGLVSVELELILSTLLFLSRYPCVHY
jgi:hypothetical protein